MIDKIHMNINISFMKPAWQYPLTDQELEAQRERSRQMSERLRVWSQEPPPGYEEWRRKLRLPEDDAVPAPVSVPAPKEATPMRQPVVLPEDPENEPCALPDGCGVLGLLRAWADHHGVDCEQALLICACTAFHTASPKLNYEYKRYQATPSRVPTLAAADDDLGFSQTVSSALEPLRAVQWSLIEKYGDQPLLPPKAFRQEIISKMQEMNYTNKVYSWWFLDPDKQPAGAARFMLEGEWRGNPIRISEKCHLYSAVASIHVKQLPKSYKARRNLGDKLHDMMCGYKDRKAAIRGFIRFNRDDLQWLMVNAGYIMFQHMLPVATKPVHRSAPTIREIEKKRCFDRIHGKAVRDLLRFRFDPSGRQEEYRVDFNDDELNGQYGKLLEIYQDEHHAVGHIEPTAIYLPELLAWYLIRLSRVSPAGIGGKEIIAYAFEAARVIRRNVAESYDRITACSVARKQRALAQKLVSRMERLGTPCKRRCLARGLNKQRMRDIAPTVELLIKHRIFTESDGMLRMASAEAFDGLGLEVFMPPLTEVWLSATKRIQTFEQQNDAEPPAATATQNQTTP